MAGTDLTFSGLMVFGISLTDGITERGRLPFVTEGDVSSSSADCGRWWTDSTSMAKRSIFMEDYAYGIADEVLKVAAVSDLATVLQSVDLVDQP